MDTFAIVLIILGVILALLVGYFAAVGVRRSQLRRTLGTFDASLRMEGARWAPGIARYADHRLEFLALISVSPIPIRRFERSSLELKGWTEPEPHDRSRMPMDSIVVSLSSDGKPFDLAMSYAAYTGLSSWLEAGPVAGVGSWRQGL